VANIGLPDSDDRTVVMGATGSGKTQFAVWLLHTRDWNKRRWFVLDFKGEKLFAQLNLTPLELTAPLPNEPGIYWIRIIPGTEMDVSNFFLRCYEAENCGILIDETYMLPYQDRWVRACLTQGRSKNIEIIACTQRPVKIDVFFFSEASYMSIFNIRLKADRDRIRDFTDGLEIKRLPPYHSLWYDVNLDNSVIFKPVPPPDILVSNFNDEIEEAEIIPDESNRIVKL